MSGRKRPRLLDNDIENIATDKVSTKYVLGKTEWLSDIHINKYMINMRKKCPGVAGLQDVLIQQKSIPYPWKKIKKNCIQIFHVNGNHWNCVQRKNGHIMIYDNRQRFKGIR